MSELAGWCGSAGGDVVPGTRVAPGTRPPQSAVHADGFTLTLRGLQLSGGPAAQTEDGSVVVVADGAPPGLDGPAPVELLRTYRTNGIEGLSRLGGAWSAAIVDRRDGRRDLVLARGGGAFPLYLTGSGPELVFASTIRALLRAAAVPRRVDGGRIRDYLAGRPPCDPAATFLAGIRRLPPGHWLKLDWAEGARAAGPPTPSPIALARSTPAPRRGGAPGGGRPTASLPSPTEFLAELPEAVRQWEEPLTGVGQYLDWRAARSGGTWRSGAGGEAEAGDVEAVAGQWLRVRRAQVEGILRSPAFCGRPYWDGLAAAEAFRRACGRPPRSMAPFWRLLNAELWLRLFVDRPGDRLAEPLGEGELEQLGDLFLRAPGAAVAACPPHRGRHGAMVGRDRAAHVRLPVRTRRVGPGDRLTEVVDDGLRGSGVPLRPGDVLILAEKIVAISQGRVVPVDRVRVRRLSRLLARFVYRTPSGISLGLPESFELAVQEAGLVRILAGSAATALTRPLGVRGVFYWFTGWEVAAIDSPDPDALPPSDTCIKLAPRDPEGVAVRLADHVSGLAGARVEVAVVDVNDIGAEVLGASRGVDRRLLVSLLRDNPLGQDTQQTPVGIVRRALGAGASR